MTKFTDASIVGNSETKLDNSISPSEVEIEGYDFLRLDQSRRGGGVVCYVKKRLAYNYKYHFGKIPKVFLLIFFYKKLSQY